MGQKRILLAPADELVWIIKLFLGVGGMVRDTVWKLYQYHLAYVH